MELLDPAAHHEASGTSESYSAPNLDFFGPTAEALDAILPQRRDLFAKPTTRTDAMLALFSGQVPYQTIKKWRTSRRAPAWALQILAERLEKQINRQSELLIRLKALLR